VRKFLYSAIVFLLFAIVPISVSADDSKWQYWQEKYNREQGDLEKDVKKSLTWKIRGLAIKEVQVSGIVPGPPDKLAYSFRGFTSELCITCHDGIEPTSNSHPRDFGCTICHGGDGQSVDMDQAHATLIYDPKAGTGRRNPSSLSVVEKSCGQASCHAGHEQADRNHIQRVKKSMMGTLSGVISGLRYQWAAQESSTAKYGMAAIADEDGDIPPGAIDKLEALPYTTPPILQDGVSAQVGHSMVRVSRHIADDLLRRSCSQCHIDSAPPKNEFRSQGCAACHFQYSEDGLYKGKDPTISTSEPGHPSFHKMRSTTPTKTCLTCHKRFVLQLGSEKKNNIALGPDLPGFGIVKPDVHFAAGFDCIDCHTQFDIMGDNNLYSRQHQAVEVRCETCHGDGVSPPTMAKITTKEDRVIRLSKHYPGWSNNVGDQMALSGKNRKMANVKAQKKKIVTIGKISGETYVIPKARNSRAHRFPPHRSKLACTACHSQWTAQCDGCHATLDQSLQKSGNSSGSQWNPARFEFKVKEPVLMVGPEGKVMPSQPSPGRTLTVLDSKGKPLQVIDNSGDAIGKYNEWKFTNPHGYSGSNLAYAMDPHSTQKKARTCASCHLSPTALGLGAGDLEIGKQARGREDKMHPLVQNAKVTKDSDFPPSAIGSPRGEPLAGFSQEGARPFSQKEIVRILRAGNCIACHDSYNDRIYRNMRRSYAFAKKQKHRDMRNKMLTTTVTRE